MPCAATINYVLYSTRSTVYMNSFYKLIKKAIELDKNPPYKFYMLSPYEFEECPGCLTMATFQSVSTSRNRSDRYVSAVMQLYVELDVDHSAAAINR